MKVAQVINGVNSKFSGKINAVKLIKELGIKSTTGFYSPKLAKKRVAKLQSQLESLANKALVTPNKTTVITHRDGRKDTAMFDFEERAAIAVDYQDSPETLKLISVSLMRKQQRLFDVIASKIDNLKYNQRKPKVKKTVVENVVAKMDKENYLEITEPTVAQVAKLIAMDIDMSSETLALADALYLPNEDRSGLVKVSNETYLKAYAINNKITVNS